MKVKTPLGKNFIDRQKWKPFRGDLPQSTWRFGITRTHPAKRGPPHRRTNCSNSPMWLFLRNMVLFIFINAPLTCQKHGGAADDPLRSRLPEASYIWDSENNRRRFSSRSINSAKEQFGDAPVEVALPAQ